MDTLTHGLVAAVVARATATDAGQDDRSRLPVATRVWVAFCAGLFPDADIVIRWWRPEDYLIWHRGVTHSFVMLPVWTALLSVIFWVLYRRRYRVMAFAPMIALGIGLHIVADLFTSFGTQVFAPLSDQRVALPSVFIIDPWYSGILLLGLVGSALRPRSRLPALASAVCLMGYIGLTLGVRAQATAWGDRHAEAAGLAPALVLALPQPLSPWHWQVVIATADGYQVGAANLAPWAKAPGPATGWISRIEHAYPPMHQATWVTIGRGSGRATDQTLEARAFAAPAFRPFRHFSLFPVALGVVRNGARRCVIFTDVRFRLPWSPQSVLRYGDCDVAHHWRVPRHLPALDPAAGASP